MERKRKIQLVARQVNFAEAEEQDDLYWSTASVEKRLEELFRLRKMFFENNNVEEGRRQIAKVVNKVSLYEQGNQS